jgi:hypothetical protein
VDIAEKEIIYTGGVDENRTEDSSESDSRWELLQKSNPIH